ncbi:MAG: hypothetical protein HY998_03585 [candidate division NC10 bacterium]|nr:hypothetical protein [candidate division NC10 bacterium]
MNPETFEQIGIPRNMIGKANKFLRSKRDGRGGNPLTGPKLHVIKELKGVLGDQRSRRL